MAEADGRISLEAEIGELMGGRHVASIARRGRESKREWRGRRRGGKAKVIDGV